MGNDRGGASRPHAVVSRVFFTRAAHADLGDALRWYEARAPHTVGPFRDSLAAVVARIEANPRQFPAASHQTRRASLRRFPYLVMFSEAEDAAYFIAIFHTRRDPRVWQGR